MPVFNEQIIDFKKEPLFFGSGCNIQEYTNPTYPVFAKLDDDMEEAYWTASEVSLIKDRAEFKVMEGGQKFIFLANLKYQITVDSIQGRGPLLAFLPVITNPELEACVITWGFFEKIHSKSYTYMIRNLFANPDDVLKHILDVPEILDRARTIGFYYDDFIDYMYKWKTDPTSVDIKLLYKKFYLALICVNILEGVRFFVSFACNFAFGENKIMEGTSKIMNLIARDEAKHLGLTQHCIKRIHDGSQQDMWVDIVAECKQEVNDMFVLAAQQEKDWATYLFENGSMLGLTEPILHQYIEHMTNKRMKSIGFKPHFHATPNPLTWMNRWLSSKAVQVAPQETEIESYLIGAIDSDISNDDFKGLDF